MKLLLKISELLLELDDELLRLVELDDEVVKLVELDDETD